MAGGARTETHPLSPSEALERSPGSFDFHQALRRLECVFRDKPRFGQAVRTADEPLRLGQDPSMAFAESAISSFSAPFDGRPGRLGVSFFGLFGPHGALPTHITEYVRDRMRNAKDATLASFADIFHHRMLSLFHRAWAAAQPTASQDRESSSRFSLYVGALFGLALPALAERDSIPDRAKLQYAGRLASPTRNAEGLRAVVAHYFGIPVEIEQFVGEWVEIPENSRFRLGYSRDVSAVGLTTVIGARAFRCDHKFRLVLGPLSREKLPRFLPGAPNLERIRALVKAYLGDEFSWDIRLTLAQDAEAPLTLGRVGRMGWNTRLGSGRDSSEDLVVDPSNGQTKRVPKRKA